MRIFWNYKSPEVYELVNLAPERGREKERGEREVRKKERGRQEGGREERERSNGSNNADSKALSPNENHDIAIPIFTHHRQHFWTYLDFQLLLSSSN